MSKVQQKMQAVLDAAVAEGRERGVQLAVYLNGRLVVDAWAGHADPGKTKEVTGDTLFPIFSVTKGIASTALHLTVERGLIDYDAPIAQVWPEFAANGKGGITLRHVLNHTAGLQMMPVGLTLEDIDNWDTMSRLLAAATPVSPPGESQVYHAVNFGNLVGEVIRRVDGRPIERVVQEDIGRPLGIRDLYIGSPASIDSRVAVLEEPTANPQPSDDVPMEVAKVMWPLHAWMNRPASRRGVVPGSNGIMTARAIARHYAALLSGGVDGVQLLSDERRKLVTTLSKPGGEKKIGLGYMIGNDHFGDSAFGHGGYGGAQGLAVQDRGLAIGFAKNYFSPQGATGDVLAALKRELDSL